MFLLDDTIAAIATPLGVGGVGVVRVSGLLSCQVLKTIVIRGVIEPNRAYRVWLPRGIDEAVVTFFKSPNSYTGEDVIEISCHGSPVVVRQVLDMVLDLGVRHAGRGEFTQRAFLNGKIDLIQAEAVLSLVNSQTETAAQLSVSQLKGRLSKKILDIKKQCLLLLSDIQASIDFPDDVNENPLLANAIEKILCEIDNILSTANYGKIIKNGITAVIIGKPNVGKSSLMNAFLRENRAIVTNVPGTTRDAIIETVNLKGLALILVDTAGIRDPVGVIEEMGIIAAKGHIEAADLLLVVFDASASMGDEDRTVVDFVANKRHLKVLNKADLGVKLEMPGVKVSALRGEGIEELESCIYDFVMGGGLPASDSVLTSERQVDCLRKAKTTLQNALETAKMNCSLDMISADAQEAMGMLDEMLGIHVGDEVLGKIFSEFCVGK